MDEFIKEIVDDGANGELDVQISPIGTFAGSKADGSPIEENITQEALEKLAVDLNSGDEILVDTDHKSTLPGANKDSSANGWLSNFYTTVKGLFAKMKLTKRGRELVDNREYRHLSPVFSLDANGTPIKLRSVAMTNTPAFAGSIEPILNSKPIEPIQLEETSMTKEELVELIKQTIADMKAEEAEVQNEEPTAEAEEPKEEKTEDVVENACSEDEKEVKNDEAEVEPKEEKEEEKKEEIKKDPEIIDEEVLNSAPNPSTDISAEPWRDLHGKAFFDYLKKHPECK